MLIFFPVMISQTFYFFLYNIRVNILSPYIASLGKHKKKILRSYILLESELGFLEHDLYKLINVLNTYRMKMRYHGRCH